MINKTSWVDLGALDSYIRDCQDQLGGISDKPGNNVDVFHTFFGLAALSLLDEKGELGLEKIDPIYAIPKRTLQ